MVRNTRIYTNKSSITNLKNIGMDIIERLPKTKEEIVKAKEEYDNILYLIDIKSTKDEDLSDFCKIIKKSSETDQFRLDFSTEGVILINPYAKVDLFNEININKLIVDEKMAIVLVNTIEKLMKNCDTTLIISSFIESFNEEVLFYKHFNDKSSCECRTWLSQQLKHISLKDKDIRLVVIMNSRFINKDAQKDLYQYIKEINNYAEINIIELESQDEFLEIYCFKDKVNYINVSTNVSTLKNINGLRYVQFIDSLRPDCDIYIVDEESSIKEFMINENSWTGFPMTISTNSNYNLSNVSAVIPAEKVVEYLGLLEKFYSKKVIITMADISWVKDLSKGKLTYYNKQSITNLQESLERFKEEISTEKLSGNAILFVMKEDLSVLNKYANVLNEMYPNLNISCCMPRKIYGDIQNYVQLFIFEGDL